jgi:predicted Rossmann-fold nucleotide-binding protein
MKKSPLLTEDGYLIIRGEDKLILDEALDAPQMTAVMRLEETSDTLRGVLGDLMRGSQIRERCSLIGRSGHSQVGLDVGFAGGDPEIHNRQRMVEIPIILTSLNRNIPDVLFAELKNLTERGLRPTIARLFIPMSAPLVGASIEDAIRQSHIFLPSSAQVASDGTIEIPLENVRYLLSTTLLTAGQNAQDVLLQSKAGLSLIQHLSHRGLPEVLYSREFLVGAIKISLGPYLALLERQSSDPEVFHLAARLLDAVRTSGIDMLRQVELCNGGEDPVDPRTLKARMRLYPADPATAKVAERIFVPGRAERIIREGVDFADATGIFDLGNCQPLFDNLSASQDERGNYARILSRNRVTEIPREVEEGEWHESIQDRVICEVVRGKITSGVHRGDQIPPELRGFVDSLESVGGAQDLRQVYVASQFPVTDTLRTLKRNDVGVFVARSIRSEKEAVNGPRPKKAIPPLNLYFDQTTYETFCDMEGKDGVRFYMVFGEGEEAHVREFFKGFWVTREAKERLEETHTVIAMFGSHVEGTEEVLTEQIRCFLQELKGLPGFDGRFAVCHGAGSGVMRIADEAAAELEVLRIGIGMDSEKVGQKANLQPPVMVNFKNSARHLRQDILDRTSLCKIYNIGGMGTLEELLIAITNLKLFETPPAPHIFVDPFGLGEDGEHLWELVIRQLRTTASAKKIGAHTVRLAPAWVPNFCHVVRDYSEALAVIKDFVHDPAAYWEQTGIRKRDVCQAYDNAKKAGITVPPYIEKAMKAVTWRPNG